MDSQEGFDFCKGKRRRGGRDLSIRSIQISVGSDEGEGEARRSVKSWNYAGDYPVRDLGVGRNGRGGVQEDLEGFKHYWLDLEDYTNKVFVVKRPRWEGSKG